MAITEIIDKETGETKKIAIDGRIMHENSLANIGSKRWQPGQSGNPNGRPKLEVSEKLFRAELIRALQQPVSKEEKKAKMLAVIDRAIDKLLTTENDITFLRLFEIVQSSIDGKMIAEHVKNTETNIQQNILVLPAQNGKIALPKAKNDSTENE